MDGNSNTRGVDTCPMRLRRDPPSPPLNVSPGSRSRGGAGPEARPLMKLNWRLPTKFWKRELEAAALTAVEMQLSKYAADYEAY